VNDLETKLKVSLDGGEYILHWGGRETRVPLSSTLEGCVKAAAELSDLGPEEIKAWRKQPGQDAEKWVVQPKDVVAAIQGLRSSLEEAASLSQGGYRAEETAVEVGEIFIYTGDRPFIGRVQVTALGRPSSRYMKVTFRCGDDNPKCAECPINRGITLDFTGGDIDPSAFASYFDTDNPRDALRVLTERGLKPICMGWLRSVRIEGSEEKAVTPAVVIDRQGTEGQAWFVHGPRCDLKRAPNWVTAMGWLCHGSKGRIGVLVTEFTTESEVMVPTDEELAHARTILRGRVNPDPTDLEKSMVQGIAEALKRRSQLKGGEIVKGYTSDLLTVSSPTWVKTLEGKPQLGATSSELGPTTTAKSQREMELVDWLGAGRYHAGRMTEAGLTAGAEQVKDLGWILRKGLLPSMDLSFLVLDNMPFWLLDRQIESRRNGIVQLAAMKGAELWARCRLKLLGNPAQPFDETLHRCVALKIYDSKLIARFAFAVFTYGVSVEERYTPEFQTPLAGDEELLEAARTVIRWNMSKERTYTTRPEHWPLIMKLGRLLEEKFGCEDIPLLLRSTPYKLAVVAYPFALLEGFEEPEERHIQLAYEWLKFCAKDIELDKYVVEWRRSHELGEAEYEKISEKLQEQILDEVKIHSGTEEETETYRLIEYVAKHASATRDEVAGFINMVPKTVTEKAQLLKGLGLLRSDKDGYHFTAKGVRFLRRWLPERTQVTDVTDVTGHVRADGLSPESDGAEPLPSRVGGNMSNIGNLKKPALGGEFPPARGTPAPPSSGGAGEEFGAGEEPDAATEGPSPDPFEAVMGIWTGLEKDEGGASLLGDLGELLNQDGFRDPYGLIARASSPEWRTQERWWIELVGAKLKPLGEEGECVSCQRPAQLYADVEGMWPVCLRCRLGQPATAPGQQWRFRMVMREEVA
jgi:hypothetical protein